LFSTGVELIRYPQIPVKYDKVKAIQRRHPWVFSRAFGKGTHAHPGSIVDLVDPDGLFLARGYYNPHSQIAVRLLTWNEQEIIDQNFWRKRIVRALAVRSELARDGKSNAWRLLNSEGDGVPGLIVDQYADVVVVQSTTLGMDQMLPMIVPVLQELTGCKTVIERSNDNHRKHEGVEPAERHLAGPELLDEPLPFVENGNKFVVDLRLGHKSGYYLDQKDNRRAVAELCQGKRVLDCFTYSGSFSVHALANGAEHATLVDSSAPALETARQNLARNDFAEQRFAMVRANGFEFMREQSAKGALYDVVILDPPKLVKSMGDVQKGARAYQDLNRQAMKCLKPGGYLATFSCSGHMSLDLFQKVIFSASVEANCELQMQRILLQSRDHSIHFSVPETLYLKGFICRKLG